jgi:DNA polymerase-3 subunit beta
VKFRCERDILADALVTASRAATSRTSTHPVLAGLRLDVSDDQLTLTGTDLELTIRLSVEVGMDTEGSAVVPARLVTDIVRALPAGTVTVETNSDDVIISAGRAQFAVRPFAVDDYPAQAGPDGEPVSIDAALLMSALRQVVRAASTDEARPVLTGVLISADEEGLWVVATDGYRLAVRNLGAAGLLTSGQSVLIPARALSELQRLLPAADHVSVRFGSRSAEFELGTTYLSTRLIDGDFPNYRNLLPSSHPNTLTIGREALLEALRRVRILAQDSRVVRLSLGGEVVELTVVAQDVGNASEAVDARYEGAEMVVGFNPDFLAAGADALDGDELTVELNDPGKPVVLRGVGDDDYLYLLMPVRV